MKNSHYLFLITMMLSAAVLSGCGYTTKTNLPDHVRSVHVTMVPNRIDISSEVSSDKPFQTYRPGLEIELRNALIERFIFDGHLRVESSERSDSVIHAALTGFDRDPVRYDADDSIQEFRLHVTASVEFKDKIDDKVLWKTESISGESAYFLSGANAGSEDEAVAEALEDLVRRIVEHVIEIW